MTYLLKLGLIPFLLVKLELCDVLVGLLLDGPEKIVPIADLTVREYFLPRASWTFLFTSVSALRSS